MDTEKILKQLNIIRILAIADAILLVPLVLGAILDWGIAPVLGPIHGIGFLALILLTARGAQEEWWGWWFPVVVIVTLGPPGSLYGDLRVRRELNLPKTA